MLQNLTRVRDLLLGWVSTGLHPENPSRRLFQQLPSQLFLRARRHTTKPTTKKNEGHALLFKCSFTPSAPRENTKTTRHNEPGPPLHLQHSLLFAALRPAPQSNQNREERKKNERKPVTDLLRSTSRRCSPRSNAPTGNERNTNVQEYSPARFRNAPNVIAPQEFQHKAASHFHPRTEPRGQVWELSSVH